MLLQVVMPHLFGLARLLFLGRGLVGVHPSRVPPVLVYERLLLQGAWGGGVERPLDDWSVRRRATNKEGGGILTK